MGSSRCYFIIQQKQTKIKTLKLEHISCVERKNVVGISKIEKEEKV